MSCRWKVAVDVCLLLVALGFPLNAQRGSWEELNAQAILYHDQGQYGEAERLYRRALAIRPWAGAGSGFSNEVSATVVD